MESIALDISDIESYIIKNFETISFKAQQVIFNANNSSYGLFFIKSGKIKVFKTGNDGKEQIIRIAKPGNFIGYRAILTNDKHCKSATAIEPANLSFIPKEDFNELLDLDRNIAAYFTRLLCNDLSEAEEKIVALAYKPVRGRLAETLISLSAIYKDEKKSTSEIPISRKDLAGLIGTAKETVIRLLSEFKSEKLIGTDGKVISILNPEGLSKVHHLYT